ncbi:MULTISPECIES: hypothetical protein [unclassified Phaeobacter]
MSLYDRIVIGSGPAGYVAVDKRFSTSMPAIAKTGPEGAFVGKRKEAVG